MNIRDAKIQIMNALRSYFEKDEYGDYIIPIERQRPVFLMGPPGVGKTAIMEQIASELGVGLLSYAMTQHTISTILGQAYVAHKNYKGKEFDVSEYTMSELIASIYDLMEETGIKEGILFLDEINCVNETLAPIMLQFMQYKMVGRHQVPDGWIVVTAGNPLEYNSNAREFDIVTWDRLKRVDVDPDLGVWKEYAYHKNLHQSILSYLEVERLHFYRIETEIDTKIFITARSWEDLSQIMILYEKLGIPVDEKLISQYIQIPKICANFTGFYNLFNASKEKLRIDDIVEGYIDEPLNQTVAFASQHEIVILRGLLNSALSKLASIAIENTEEFIELQNFENDFNENIEDSKNAFELFDRMVNEITLKNESDRKSGAKSKEKANTTKNVIRILKSNRKCLKGVEKEKAPEALSSITKQFSEELSALIADTGIKFNNVIYFLREHFDNGEIMEKFIDEVDINDHITKYIASYGCDAYELVKNEINTRHLEEAAAPPPPKALITPKHENIYKKENNGDTFMEYNPTEHKISTW